MVGTEFETKKPQTMTFEVQTDTLEMSLLENNNEPIETHGCWIYKWQNIPGNQGDSVTGLTEKGQLTLLKSN
jgi:hypothetical protein